MAIFELYKWLSEPWSNSTYFALGVFTVFLLVFISIEIFLVQVRIYLKKIRNQPAQTQQQCFNDSGFTNSEHASDISRTFMNNSVNINSTNHQVAQSDLPPEYDLQIAPPPSYDAIFKEESRNEIFYIKTTNL